MTLDRSTFESLYYLYGPRLSAYALKFLADKDMSEDLIQDVFIRFWEHYKGKSSDTWAPVLFTMVRNRCLDALKHLACMRSTIVQNVNMTEEEERLYIETFTQSLNPEDQLLLKELESFIQEISSHLPPRCREVFEMSRLQGLKNAEIAARLGISEKAVEKHISKALRAFRQGLQKKDRHDSPKLLGLINLIVFFI